LSFFQFIEQLNSANDQKRVFLDRINGQIIQTKMLETFKNIRKYPEPGE
jgi:hypothetical protein